MSQTAHVLSRTEEVMHAVRRRIDRRALTPGARLPSIRAMATSLGCSKSTVVDAYDRLTAEGVIRSRPGAGFFVSAPLAPLTLADMAPGLDKQIDPLWMLRRSLELPDGAHRPGCGWLPEDWMPEEILRKGLRALARSGPSTTLLGYATARGSETLRRLIARRLLDQGVDCAPDQVLLTDSGTQAIDLVMRLMIEPGDAVLVDDPCYFNFLTLLRAHRAEVIGVPFAPTGPDLEAFARALEERRPRLYLTNSGVQNPTGAAPSATTAHRVLKLAEAHDLVIVEDDTFADFEHETAPRLAAFDGLDRVIRVGSFSKTLSAAFRCGHIAARPDWITALMDLRISTGMSGNPAVGEILYSVLTDGSYRRHMERVRVRLARARAQAIPKLKAIGFQPWIEPQAGMFVWCRAPNDLDAADLARRALERGVVLAPGNVFSVSQSAAGYLRFNVALMQDEGLFEILEDLCARA